MAEDILSNIKKKKNMDYEGKFTGPEIDERLEKAEKSLAGNIIVRTSEQPDGDNANAYQKITEAIQSGKPIIVFVIRADYYDSYFIPVYVALDGPDEALLNIMDTNGSLRGVRLSQDGRTRIL